MASEFSEQVFKLAGDMARHGEHFSDDSLEFHGLSDNTNDEAESPMDALKLALAAASDHVMDLERIVEDQTHHANDFDRNLEAEQDSVLATAAVITTTLDGSGNPIAEQAIETATSTVIRVDEMRAKLDESNLQRAAVAAALGQMHQPLFDLIQRVIDLNGLLNEATSTTRDGAAAAIAASDSANQTADHLEEYGGQL